MLDDDPWMTNTLDDVAAVDDISTQQTRSQSNENSSSSSNDYNCNASGSDKSLTSNYGLSPSDNGDSHTPTQTYSRRICASDNYDKRESFS